MILTTGGISGKLFIDDEDLWYQLFSDHKVLNFKFQICKENLQDKILPFSYWLTKDMGNWDVYKNVTQEILDMLDSYKQMDTTNLNAITERFWEDINWVAERVVGKKKIGIKHHIKSEKIKPQHVLHASKI